MFTPRKLSARDGRDLESSVASETTIEDEGWTLRTDKKSGADFYWRLTSAPAKSKSTKVSRIALFPAQMSK